ncbi:family 16 glycosylhydrolase [Rhizobium rhizogenes]
MTTAFDTDTTPDISGFATSHVPAVFHRLRMSPHLAWFGWPITYAVGTLLLTMLGSGTTLMAARLLDPVQFGTFALLTSLFTYASRADLGMSQLADKRIPGKSNAIAEHAGLEILVTLWIVGAIALAASISVVLLVDGFGVDLPILGATFAITGGIMGMIANGPATLFRAASKVWEFTVLALILQIAMTVPRLAGLVLGGVDGSFAAVAIYYTLCAVLLARPLPRLKKRPPLASMAQAALPLFAFNASWTFYLSANRWISSVLSSPHDLGLLSFGASLAMIGLGIMAAIAQVRYPKMLARMSGQSLQKDSAVVEREVFVVTLALSLVALCAVFVSDRVIAAIFPAYTEAVPATIALAVSCVSLGAMVWIVPMIIVRSQSPGLDSMKLFAVGFGTLLVTMTIGNSLAGIDGQAWGNVAASLLMLAAMVALMCRLGMLTVTASWRIVSLQGIAAATLAFLAFLGSAQAAAVKQEPAQASVAGWKTIFKDDFSTLDFRAGGKGTWKPLYPWGARNNASNREMQYYVDPRPSGDNAAVQALAPFTIDNGILAIRASKIPESLRIHTAGFEYASGMLTTAGRFSFTYGRVEIRARMPSGKGLWPAFWLLPADKTWPPEIDVFEVLGQDTRRLHVTAHSSLHIPAGARSAQKGTELVTADLSDNFHVYGVTWTKDSLVWSLDDQIIFSTPTPPDMHKPMYLLVNLAVGGSWPGSPDASTHLPANLLVDWIQVKQPEVDNAVQEKGITQ